MIPGILTSDGTATGGLADHADADIIATADDGTDDATQEWQVWRNPRVNERTNVYLKVQCAYHHPAPCTQKWRCH